MALNQDPESTLPLILTEILQDMILNDLLETRKREKILYVQMNVLQVYLCKHIVADSTEKESLLIESDIIAFSINRACSITNLICAVPFSALASAIIKKKLFIGYLIKKKVIEQPKALKNCPKTTLEGQIGGCPVEHVQHV